MLEEKEKMTKKFERKTEEKVKERKMMKSRKGITLIALIITIIVLLILAGVSLSLVVGDNGVLNQAEKSAKRTNEEEAKEQVGMELAGSYDESGYVNLTTLNNNLRNNLEEKVEIKEEAEDGTVTYKELTEDNEIEELPKTVKYKGVDVELDGETGPRYLVDKVEIGDYVDIGLKYDTTYTKSYEFNSSAHSNGYVETTKALTGWRVLSKEGEGASGKVKLISAGCPLTYYHPSGREIEGIDREFGRFK